MLDFLGVILSFIASLILIVFKYIGNFVIKYLMPKSLQAKWEADSDGTLIIGGITFLILVGICWWLLARLKN